uniref:Uncharacterized protein n=1 Tax=Anguilla anguilla TaxID=7936 RepID=A0A0E9PG38_ANGAN
MINPWNVNTGQLHFMACIIAISAIMWSSEHNYSIDIKRLNWK